MLKAACYQVSIVFCFVAIHFGTVSLGLACSCSGIPSIQEEYDSSDIVVLCLVADRIEPEPRPWNGEQSERVISTGDMIKYVVVPVEVWKGALDDSLVVFSERGQSSCGFPMDSGSEYLVFASQIIEDRWPLSFGKRHWGGGDPEFPLLKVNGCSNSREKYYAYEAMRELGAPFSQKEKSSKWQ